MCVYIMVPSNVTRPRKGSLKRQLLNLAIDQSKSNVCPLYNSLNSSSVDLLQIYWYVRWNFPIVISYNLYRTIS